MAVDIQVDISEETGSFARIFSPSGYNISEIFTGTPQFYPGSTVQIQEIITINTVIDEDLLISTDFRWFERKRRRGTYQVGKILISNPYCDEDEGYIDYDSQSIRRYSNYTITAAPDTAFGKHEQIALDNCNAYLTPDLLLFPNDPTPDPGFRFYDANPLFLGSNTISKAPLRDTPFNQRMSGVGIHLYAGVRGSSLRYQVSVINDIYTDYTPVVPPTCLFLPSSCNAQFTAFLLSNPAAAFTDEVSCLQSITDGVSVGSGCVLGNWVCPTDPTQSFPFYSPIAN